VVAALDALGEPHLLRGGEQVDLADVLEEQLQRVGRDLTRLRRLLGLFASLGDDLDLGLLERDVELVELSRVQVELVERERDLLRRQRAVLLARSEQRPRFIRVKDVPNRPASRLLFWCVSVHSAPLR
jgi:hypothetical protein